MKRILLCAVALALCAATQKGVDDGNAGLAALDKGDYAEAVRLFSNALKDVRLPPSDREFAYLSRGKAYLHIRQFTLAAADFREAQRLRPDDEDARTGLRLALARDDNKGRSAGSTERQMAARWGPMAKLADKYWLVTGNGPEMYLYYQWQTPGRALVYSGLDKQGHAIAGQCDLPSDGSAIGCHTSYKSMTGTASIAVQQNSYQETAEGNGVTIRETYSLAGPDDFHVVSESYQNGSWKLLRTVDLAAVPAESIAALRWKEHKSGVGRFLGNLGKSILAGALFGLQSGGQDPDQSSDPGQTPQ
jgi:tetratricopeptide (TPR) repeat protein